MYSVGDKVVYPMHGAGIIEAIEVQEVLGDEHEYYILLLPIGEMRVMIPKKTAMEIGLRPIISAEESEAVLKVVAGDETQMSTNWNHRYRANLEKIKSGDIYAVAEVVRNLSIRDQEKGLSTGERKMLENARKILVSELVLVRSSTEEAVEQLLADCLGIENPAEE